MRGAAFTVALLCCASISTHAAPPDESSTLSARLLAQAESASKDDPSRFAALLKQINESTLELTPEQKLHLQYLNTLSTQNSGHDAETIKSYEHILSQTKDPSLSVSIRVKLVALLRNNNQYLQAYTIANTLMEEYPNITDTALRLSVLMAIARVKVAQHQYDDALSYTKQMEALVKTHTSTPSRTQERLCYAKAFQAQILVYKGDATGLGDSELIASTRAPYDEAVDICLRTGLIGQANALRLDRASLINEYESPARALVFLRSIAPSIRKSGIQPQIASLHVTFSQIYLRLNKLDLAIKSAQAAVAAANPKGHNWMLEAAYEVLYQAAQKQGDSATALAMYQKYIDQYKTTVDDAQAQAVAYQMVKQDVMAKKLKLEELGKQNKILQLRQSLDRKSAETSRLYILLLLFVLASIALWAYRTKHSQLRFRRMAREDDLTGAFNRQHFLEQAESILHRLQKTDGEACLMILDMDHFKRVNDQYGHVSGDTVLRHVTGICRGELRASDVFGRLGGEEFGVLMPNCTPQQGKDIGDRIRHTLVTTPVEVREDESLTITTSIGLTSTRRSGYQLKRLLIHADEALYEAKRNGRNQLVIRST
ncbi:GGDEF domain-containing protein [Oleiagrimonas soli]|uniref:diguanylate cyclase n=1 Tax=Oleiagrimonas soli TaxID=1543381 RepID=A0A841KN90_9GAMM|nr:GGDEF domain-containing protein [Oleiagrimonas soli]MBB6185337.1 diguanylate cyclase (GGDEF)-like protein [Oleiagrimonas soli]